MNSTELIGWLGLSAYLVAGLLLAIGRYRDLHPALIAGACAAAIGVAAHAYSLYGMMVLADGVDLNFFNTLSLSALLVAAVILMVATRTRVIEVGVVAFPGAALCLALVLLVSPEPLLMARHSVMVRVHVIGSLLAYSLLSIAALHAMYLAIQERLLHRPTRLNYLDLLPPLTVMERMLFQLVFAGWLLLTVSVATGLLFVSDLMAQHLAHKTILSILSWLIFGLLLLGRWRFGWRSRLAIRLTLAAMALLLLGYFGSKLVLEVLLGRQWQGALP